MRRHRIIQHGPRRRWWAPWHQVCRCGLDAWPCPVVRMREAQGAARPASRTEQHGWDQPTTHLQRAPLLTLCQARRTRHGGRW